MAELLGFNYFIDADQRIYIGYMLSALVLALLFFWHTPAILKRQFSKKILWHKSAQLDYLYFMISTVIKMTLLIPLLIGVSDVAYWTVMQLQHYFGYMERIRVDKLWLVLGYSCALFIVNDFTRYWLHRLMHTVPILWRFHRVHHSAEVLNPLTYYRIHPIEHLLFGLRYAVSVGMVTAIFIYFFGAGIALYEILGVNIFVFVFSLLGANLRHSHIPLSFGTKVEKWIISPYQHQLHHTKAYSHKNYGSYLAIWDFLFKTHTSTKKENLTFGLKDEQITHSLLGLFLNPFIKGIKL
ncbi:MAG: sterol desaturase family protein [Epsilonproteobacteria bacterium]|nr:sterol desaturase family protein [Campylobacterota bacterium]